MRYTIVSVFDRAAQAFAKPVFVPAVQVAVRSFGDEVRRGGPDNAVSLHPGDYELFELGLFDDENAEFVIPARPVRLCVGSDFVQPLGGSDVSK